MKRIFALTALVMTAIFVPNAAAQYEDSDAVRLTRSAIQAERQEILAANLDLTEEQKNAFWPLYLEYRRDLEATIDTRVEILERFFAGYETLTDAEAIDLMEDYASWEKQVQKIQNQHSKKMLKQLPGLVVLRFFQIENKMNVIVDYELAGEIPLVR